MYCSSIRAYGRHRARHVADQHQLTGPLRRRPPAPMHRLAAGPQRRLHGARADRECAPRRRDGLRPARQRASGAAGPAARSAHAPAPSRPRCTARSPSRAAARPRSMRRERARRRRRGGRRSADRPIPARGQRRPLDRAQLRRAACRRPRRPAGAEHLRERLVEALQIGAARAQHRAQRQPCVLARGGVDRVERSGPRQAARRRRPRAPVAQRGRRASDEPLDELVGRGSDQDRSPVAGPAVRHPPAPRARAPADTSSCTFSAAPSVSSRSASSPSASSACAHTIVSPTPGSLYRSPCSRSRPTALDDPRGDPLGHLGQPRLRRSRARARATGSRSSGTGSGA